MCSWGAAVAAVFIAAAGYHTADAQKKSAEYTAQVAEHNAELDDFKAGQVAQIGAIQEEQHRAKVRQMAGAQRANLAANGIDLGSGTAQDIVDETYTLGEADALTIRFNAMNESWGYRTQAANERDAAAFSRVSGKNQARGTYLSTAASIAGLAAGGAGGASAAASSGSSYSSTGTGASGMTYTAPSTKAGSSWLNGYNRG